MKLKNFHIRCGDFSSEILATTSEEDIKHPRPEMTIARDYSVLQCIIL